MLNIRQGVMALQNLSGVVFEPGDIVQLDPANAQAVIKSNGVSPFGMVTNVISNTNTVLVQYDRFCASTDRFESDGYYQTNSLLYASVNGLLTTTQINNYPAVGMVTQSPSTVDPHLYFMWY